MANIKHIGRLKTNKRRAIVPYRTIPGDPYSCLVVFVDTLSADEHDTLIKTVESSAGQQAYELAEVMNRTFLPDGRNMLVGFYKTGKLQKIATSDVEMIPNSTTSIGLDQLNQLIADQRGVALEDLSIKPKETKSENSNPASVSETLDGLTNTEEPTTELKPLSDEDLARKYRSDADRLSKEAANLRRMAEELVPSKKAHVLKKTSVKTKESVQ